MVKRFATFDDRRRTLTSGGQPVKLSGQALDLLALLLERPGELVTRGEIERRLWPDRTVEFDHGVDVVVSRLRAILGAKGSDAACVETVPRRGYRWVAPVIVATGQPPPSRRARRVLTYAANAVLAAMLTILIARTRYDRFIPPAPVTRPSTSLVRPKSTQGRAGGPDAGHRFEPTHRGRVLNTSRLCDAAPAFRRYRWRG